MIRMYLDLNVTGPQGNTGIGDIRRQQKPDDNAPASGNDFSIGDLLNGSKNALSGIGSQISGAFERYSGASDRLANAEEMLAGATTEYDKAQAQKEIDSAEAQVQKEIDSERGFSNFTTALKEETSKDSAKVADEQPKTENKNSNNAANNGIKFYNKAQRKAAEEIQHSYKNIKNNFSEVYPQSRKAMANYYQALKNAKSQADVDRAIADVKKELGNYVILFEK
ncbi:hypothetical protein IJG72_00830 [bacterium]|nr:hypothetical protein [bacterium]